MGFRWAKALAQGTFLEPNPSLPSILVRWGKVMMRAYVLSKTATLLGEACRSLSCLDFAHFPSDRRLQLALRCHNNWQPANCWATSLAKPSSETRYPQIQNGLHTSISYQYIIIFSYVSHIFPMKVYNHKMVKYPIEPWDAA